MIPLILSRVGTESYGLWLACGDLLAYSAMVDFGVLNVLPWIIAEKDGQKDRQAMRQLIGTGVAVAVVIGILYFLVAIALWYSAATLADLNQSQRAMLAGPILLLITGTAICFPLRAFYSVIIGLQDVAFSGLVSIAQWVVNISLVLVLLLNGYGLYALAVSAIVPVLAQCIACLVRIKMIAPDLLSGWGRPSLSKVFYLSKEGIGAWLGGFGWRMMAASNSIIIVAIGSPDMVVVYACTAKVGEILMQMAWQLPDSGLIGLAQLSGEGNRERVREVVMSMFRLLLITVGGVACVVLFFNPSFVSLWVGADKFGGFTLNAMLAASLISVSLTHGVTVPAAVLGSRFQVGVLALVQGIFYLGIAVAMGKAFGLPGIASASIISSILLAIPMGARLLKERTELKLIDLWKGALMPWTARAVLLLVVGAAVGISIPMKATWAVMAVAPLLGFLYLWHMRPLYTGLPLPLSLRPWLIKMRLIPQP